MAFWHKLFKKTPEEAQKKEAGRESERKISSAPAEKKRTRILSSAGIKPGVLLFSRLTEKASRMAKENKHVFAVARHAPKHDIARAVEARFGVHVDSVRVIRLPEKERRRGRQIGWKPGFKKAIVKVREGETIEIT